MEEKPEGRSTTPHLQTSRDIAKQVGLPVMQMNRNSSMQKLNNLSVFIDDRTEDMISVTPTVMKRAYDHSLGINKSLYKAGNNVLSQFINPPLKASQPQTHKYHSLCQS